MEMTDPQRWLSRQQEKRLLKVAADFARTQFDSPDRAGCPATQHLELLARRRYPLENSAPLVDHIATCSPCFVEYTQFRTTYNRRVRITYALMSAAAAIVLALGFAAMRSLHIHGSGPSRQEEAVRPPEPARELTELTLDLRKEGIARSEQPDRPSKGNLPHLPRANLSLSIYLPIGSEDGIYDVALTRGGAEPVLNTTGQAKLVDHIDVLPVRFDLTNVLPGRYELRLRHAQSQWRAYWVLLE